MWQITRISAMAESISATSFRLSWRYYASRFSAFAVPKVKPWLNLLISAVLRQVGWAIMPCSWRSKTNTTVRPGVVGQRHSPSAMPKPSLMPATSCRLRCRSMHTCSSCFSANGGRFANTPTSAASRLSAMRRFLWRTTVPMSGVHQSSFISPKEACPR